MLFYGYLWLFFCQLSEWLTAGSSGEGGCFVIFRIFKFILFFCQMNFIVLFPFLIKCYHILFIIIAFWLGCDKPSGHFFFVPALLFSILMPLSLPPSYFSYLLRLFLAVPMRKCLGKHLCMSSPFPIAILNGTFYFRSVKAMNNWKRSAIKQILLLLLLLQALHCYSSEGRAGCYAFPGHKLRLVCHRSYALVLSADPAHR